MLEINAARVIQAITNITLDLSEEVEEVDMCKAIDDMMQDSREEGKAEGRTEGILFALTGLVRDGVLSIKDAAFRANMTESAFEAAMKKNINHAKRMYCSNIFTHYRNTSFSFTLNLRSHIHSPSASASPRGLPG